MDTQRRGKRVRLNPLRALWEWLGWLDICVDLPFSGGNLQKFSLKSSPGPGLPFELHRNMDVYLLEGDWESGATASAPDYPLLQPTDCVTIVTFGLWLQSTVQAGSKGSGGDQLS